MGNLTQCAFNKGAKKREPCFLDNAPVAGPWRLAFRPQAPYKSRLRCRLVGLRFAMMRGLITWHRHPPCLPPASLPSGCPRRPSASCPQGPAEDVQNRKVRLIPDIHHHQAGINPSTTRTCQFSRTVRNFQTFPHFVVQSSQVPFDPRPASPTIMSSSVQSFQHQRQFPVPPPVLIVKGQSYPNGFDLDSTATRLYFHQYH